MAKPAVQRKIGMGKTTGRDTVTQSGVFYRGGSLYHVSEEGPFGSRQSMSEKLRDDIKRLRREIAEAESSPLYKGIPLDDIIAAGILTSKEVSLLKAPPETIMETINQRKGKK